jgi:hypothetical protein
MRSPIALILIAILCLSTGGPAYAEWVELSNNEFSTTYADPDTISRKEGLVQMWVLSDYKGTFYEGPVSSPGDEERYMWSSFKVRAEYDCVEERWRRLGFERFFGHMGQGIMNQSNSDVGEWKPVKDKYDQILWKLACGKK